MDAFLVIAAAAVVLLVAEMLLPTGGVLAALGVIGLVVAGVVELGSDDDGAAYIGAGLITLGVLSAASFYFVTRKVLEAHRAGPPRGGPEELVGAVGEARSSLDPSGQVFAQGSIWGARLAAGAAPVRLGDRVTVEAVEGLTLVVRPQSPTESRAGGAI